MSEAREKYLKNSGTYDCESFGCQAEYYIKELEQQNKEAVKIIHAIYDNTLSRASLSGDIVASIEKFLKEERDE